MDATVSDPLLNIVEDRMHEAIAAGADVPELAAIAVDGVLVEVVTLLETYGAALRDPAQRDAVLGAAERIMAAQFSGWVSLRR
ncbi:hypothetical protein [Paracraurococcus lichenis]|uniref:MftR C-terminal domain-containing protein n=1 Tax=Paracraurococcus lichenis TaxID=3064888 RepID=A0ABT9E871_9PROT|nr:hypothetical protein [Paracraurococcus sp. LOR1-02]MDO9712369.1 hypothetical protein [Paracraurococcus sp. LOR1-02]